MTRATAIGADGGAGEDGPCGRTRSLRLQSWLVAAVCLIVDALSFLNAVPPTGMPRAGWIVLALIAVADGALALPPRLSGVVAVLHVAVQVTSAALLADTPMLGRANNAGALIAAYLAGAWMSGLAALFALAALLVGAGVTTRLLSEVRDPLALVLTSTTVLPWLVGRYTTARRAYIAELELRAQSRRRDENTAVERAVAAERAAIARDLHDVVSHHVSAIGVHAGAARMALERTTVPTAITRSLSAVETSSRDALQDLRQLLDLLHGDRDGDTSRQPGVANLDELVAGVVRAGRATRLTTCGTVRPLPEMIDIALYRAAQEMLTNALRHGSGGPVDVELRYGDDHTSLTVRNPVRPGATPTPRGGRGLTGLRERASHLSGSVAYGVPCDGHRWQTVVTFPLKDGPR